MVSNNTRILLWVSLIVTAELTAFALLQQSVDSTVNARAKIIIAILLFGIVVPLAFRETLKGTELSIANLYWIIASQFGSIALGYFAFGQKLTNKQFLAVGFLTAATAVQFI